MAENVNNRQFQVSANIIYSLIQAQAGSLGKGLLECIMNSVDAGATQVDIELTHTTLRITDNGKGFQSREEIEACFEVFGFEHVEGERTYGQFGMGRAQLWNFCSTIWRTHQFRMEVDIKAKGLDYALVDGLDTHPGLVIDGQFYEPQSLSDILATERELVELAMYVGVPVTFNGKVISINPESQKWTHVTEDAWIRTSQVSATLSVYNLGVKVRDFPAHLTGLGGIVVTKGTARLALNMARNDILVTECQVWKRIKPFLQAKSDQTSRKARMSEQQISNLAIRFLANQVSYEEVAEIKLITDALGNKCTLEQFYQRVKKTLDATVTIAPREEMGVVTETAHKAGHCFVMHPQTLTRFGARSVAELLQKLQSAYSAVPDRRIAFTNWRLLRASEDWKQSCRRVVAGYSEILRKDWTKDEVAAMSALSDLRYSVMRLLQGSGVSEQMGEIRELRLGMSEVAVAWTDGSTYVVFNRQHLPLLKTGLQGALRLVNVLIHEHLHEDPSTDTHVHDGEFYERFHRVQVFEGLRDGTSVGQLASFLLRRYVYYCSKGGIKLKPSFVKDCDTMGEFELAV